MDQKTRIAHIKSNVEGLRAYPKAEESSLLDQCAAIVAERKKECEARTGDAALGMTEQAGIASTKKKEAAEAKRKEGEKAAVKATPA